jgi:hypothetical protein
MRRIVLGFPQPGFSGLKGSVQMRFFLAAILFCAIGAPAASALPTVNTVALGASKDSVVVQVAKRSATKPQAKKSKSGGGDSGIHPLVGSGGY